MEDLYSVVLVLMYLWRSRSLGQVEAAEHIVSTRDTAVKTPWHIATPAEQPISPI